MDDFKTEIMVGLFLISLVLGLLFFASHKQAEVFNRLSNTKTSTWDAFWTDTTIFPTK